MAWTDEQIEALKKHYVSGLSRGLIAEKMGMTRSKVIGKLHRLGLRDDPRRVKVRKPARNAGNRAAGGAAVVQRPKHDHAWRQRSVAPKATIVEAEAFVPAPDVEVTNARRRTVETIESNECRWPHGDPLKAGFYLCGAPVVMGKPYCEAHCRQAFAPPEVQRRVQASESATGGHFRFGGHPGSGAPRLPATDEPRETEDV